MIYLEHTEKNITSSQAAFVFNEQTRNKLFYSLYINGVHGMHMKPYMYVINKFDSVCQSIMICKGVFRKRSDEI